MFGALVTSLLHCARLTAAFPVVTDSKTMPQGSEGLTFDFFSSLEWLHNTADDG
jgi:hypothetical protein